MLLFCDGFDKYNTGSDLAYRWVLTQSTPTYSSTSGVKGGGGVQLGGSNTRFNASGYGGGSLGGVLTAGGVVHIAFWCKVIDAPSGVIEFFQVQTNVGGDQCRLFISATPDAFGRMPLAVNQHGSGGTTVGDSGVADGIVFNQWHHIEYAAKYDNTVGYIKVWIDRRLVINFSGDTLNSAQPTSLVSVQFVGGFASFAWVIDDPVIWDESGTDFVYPQLAVNKEHFIGTLNPDGDDAVQFTPSAGSNFQNVDDAALLDSDSTYNSSSTSDHVDDFTVSNQSYTPLETLAITVRYFARMSTVGVMNMVGRVKSGAVLQETNDFLLSGTYLMYADLRQVVYDPSTSLRWTNTAVDSLKVGYRISVVQNYSIIVPTGNLTLSTAVLTVS